jgi:peptide deformylase
MQLDLRYIGDSILREKTKEVDVITDEIRILVRDMIETMHAKNGIGLAAPQIGSLHRIFVCLVVEETEGQRFKTETQRVYINPKIESVSEEMVGMNEGCLSIPGLYVDHIMRPKTITVSSIDLEGNKIVETITGWHARVVLHENDHLNGVLFIDRLQPKQKKMVEEEVKKIKKKIEKKQSRIRH